MHRCFVGPRPAAELRALVVLHCLGNLGLGVHHERAVLRHGLVDRLALQQQKLCHLTAIIDKRGVGARLQLDRGVAAHRLTGYRHQRALEKVQLAPRAFAGGGRQRPGRAGGHAYGPDGNVSIRMRRPRIRRWGQWFERCAAGRACQPTRDDRDLGGQAALICGHLARNFLRPQHREVRWHHLVFGRQIQPDLKQFQRVRPGCVDQWKHFGMHDARACRDPLHIAAAEASRRT